MTSLRAFMIPSVLLAACVNASPAPEVGGSSQALAAAEGQGWDLQGWDLQGWDLQGWDLQGWDLQGWDLQGGYYGTSALTGASVVANSTALETWRTIFVMGQGLRAEQRLPDRVCLWTVDRQTSYGCTVVNLATQPSPLAGVKLRGTFVDHDGDTVEAFVRIGASTTTVGAVTKGFGTAMFPLEANGGAGSCTKVPYNGVIDSTTGERCGHPLGCRRNCDLWLYDLDIVMPDGAVANFCASGRRALAVAGSYSRSGTYSPTASAMTFACEGGTIAKCTRWGYRPYGAAKQHCHAGLSCDGPETRPVPTSLVDYHRSCVRAAMADYCATGDSFTRNGTLVDIYDYEADEGAYGFIPQTASLLGTQQHTAFLWESRFDRYGAVELDYVRYAEVIPHTVETSCPSTFIDYHGGDDAVENWLRTSPALQPTQVYIDTTTACSHSELTVGKYLDRDCSNCSAAVGHVLARCNDPLEGWDELCVDLAEAMCVAGSSDWPMTPHSECAVGPALQKFATGCTLRVCLDHPSCCDTVNGTWSSACVSAAAATCRGGQEIPGSRLANFCRRIDLVP